MIETLHGKLISSTPQTDSSPDAEDLPTTYLWTLYFLAQHYSCLSRHAKALELLDAAIAHTPTLPELFMLKARVLKRCGDPYGAARCMDEARLLDLQDRFLNTKCGKYRLRAGMIDEASDIFGMFTKVGSSALSSLTLQTYVRLIDRKMLRLPAQTSRTCNRCFTSPRKPMRIEETGHWVQR